MSPHIMDSHLLDHSLRKNHSPSDVAEERSDGIHA